MRKLPGRQLAAVAGQILTILLDGRGSDRGRIVGQPPGATPDAEEWLDEQQEWLDAMDDVLAEQGADGARELVARIQAHLSHRGLIITDAALVIV